MDKSGDTILVYTSMIKRTSTALVCMYNFDSLKITDDHTIYTDIYMSPLLHTIKWFTTDFSFTLLSKLHTL